MKTRAVQQAPPHTHVARGDAVMEKPRKTVFLNDGQTKVTLIGKWFFMSAEEISEDFQSRLEAGDPLCRQINDTLCHVAEMQMSEEA